MFDDDVLVYFRDDRQTAPGAVQLAEGVDVQYGPASSGVGLVVIIFQPDDLGLAG